MDEEELELEDEFEDYDYDICYECGGYGDDYSVDEETGELVCNCTNCPFNGDDEDD